MGVFRAVCEIEDGSPRRAPAHAGWDFLDRSNRCALARSTRGTGRVEFGLSAIPPLEDVGSMGSAAGDAGFKRCGAQDGSNDRRHCYPRPPSRSGRKRGTQRQALGRSRGGFTSKIHARTNGEGLPLGFVLTPGETHDATAYDDLMAVDRSAATCLRSILGLMVPSLSLASKVLSGSRVSS